MKYTPVVQEMYAAFGRGDLPGLLKHLHPDVDWATNVDHTLPAAQPVGAWKPVRGHPLVAQFFKHVAHDYELHEFKPLSFMESGHEVAVCLRMDTTVRRTGKRFASEYMHHFTFNDAGLVTRFREFADTLAEAQAWTGA
jgi:ketosteroid isomerase-like protein